MKLEKVVPFGRSLDEYTRMFRLSDSNLTKSILGVADGPASFNAEMHAQGRTVLSLDPLYVFNATEIEAQFNAVVDNIIEQVQATPDDWVWTYHGSPEGLKRNRIRVLHDFLADYESGQSQGRYVVGELPELRFSDGQFDLALCSHFLLLYSDHYSYDFHLASIREMLRVAAEVRLFPLVSLMLQRSPYLTPLIEELKANGYSVSIETADYELQRGGNEMLRIRRHA